MRREGRNIVPTTDLGINISNQNVKNDICTHAQYSAHTHALKCLFVNARGLVSKIDVLKQYVSEMKIDIIGIAETFLNGDVMLAEISIEGFTAYRKDRGNFKEGKRGGVILYIRNEMVSYDHAELNKSESESVWCKLKIDNNSSVSFPIYVYLAAYNDIDQRQNIRITLLIQTCNFYMSHETTNCDNDTACS